MDFRDHFRDEPHIYEDATEETNLEYPQLQNFLSEWQNPHKVDITVKLTDDLRETAKVMHKNMAALLDRGEKISDLSAKTATLNKTSIEFVKKAKKANKTPWCKVC